MTYYKGHQVAENYSLSLYNSHTLAMKVQLKTQAIFMLTLEAALGSCLARVVTRRPESMVTFLTEPAWAKWLPMLSWSLLGGATVVLIGLSTDQPL